MNTRARALLLVIAITLVFGMGVHYDTQFEEQWPYPSSDNLATEYAQHVGTTLFVSGTVESVDPATSTAQIVIEHSEGSFLLTVREFDAQVQPGGVVQLRGTLAADRVIVADTVRVVNPAGSSLLFKYGVSLVGAALVTALFFRYWRIDLRELSFEARSDG